MLGSAATPPRACTTFCFEDALVFGKNYDWDVDDGLAIVNKRGVAKQSLGEPPLRWNWDSPLVLSPHSPTRLYYAANKVFRSDDRGNSWRRVSPDLTRRIDRSKLKIMGRVWSVNAVARNASTSYFGNIVALSESPKVEGLLYAGTDDGLVQVSEDGGASWQCVSRDLPPIAVVFDFNPNTFNLKSSGMWVKGVIEPPEPWTPGQIVVASLRLEGVVLMPNGQTMQHRLTFTKRADGTVRRDVHRAELLERTSSVRTDLLRAEG